MQTTPVQRGHFLLESGLHTNAWLELEAMFLEPVALEPRLDALAEQLRSHSITAVCGPLVGGALVAQSIAARLGLRFYFTERHPESSDSGLFGVSYRLPDGVRSHASGERFAVVDDVISAGSSTRATVEELHRCGASAIVVGALTLLGDVGEHYFAAQSIPVVATAREALTLWEPNGCPLCEAGVALERRS